MKREIDKKPIIPAISHKTINYLTQLCFKLDVVKPSNLIFMFGTNVFHKKAAKHIEDLLLNNYADKVLITGGIADYDESKYEELPESRIVYENIAVKRFKNVNFYLESESKNNLENVNNSIHVFNFLNVDSIICVSHSYASRRSVQTLRKVFKNTIYSFPYDIYSQNKILIQQDNWWKSEEGISILWGEYLRIKTYGKRGDFPLTEQMTRWIDKIENTL